MLRRPTNEVVIRPRLSNAWRIALFVVGVLIVTGASIAGYWGGREAVHGQLDSRAREIEDLKGQLRDTRELRRRVEVQLEETEGKLSVTREQLEETRSSLTKLTRQLQIDKSAYAELRKELEESNRQITELGSELKFYRSIISPADGRSGVRIQELHLEATGDGGEYRYRLMLLQALEHEDNVKGTVRFEIGGTEQGNPKTIVWPGKSGSLVAVNFKYFQNLAGTLKLPPDFLPAEITVIFKAEDDAVVKRMYPWPERDEAMNS